MANSENTEKEKPSRGRGGADSGLVSRLVYVGRVATVVKGGKRFRFSALVVVGDGKGRIGIGTGKAKEVPEAVAKAEKSASKTMFRVPLKEGRTLHHDAHGHYGAGRVVLRAAPSGTGVIAGGPMRMIFEALGIQDVVAKSVGTSNPHNMVKATVNALFNISTPRSVAAKRGKKVSEVFGNAGGRNKNHSSDVEAEGREAV